MKSVGAAINDLLNEFGDGRTSSPLCRDFMGLLLCGDIASQEEPEEAFGERLLSAGGPGKDFLAFGNLRCRQLD